MSESLGDLLRRTADAVPEPRLYVGELVAQAGRRQRRRRLAVVASTAAVVGAIVAGSFVVWGGQPRDLEPAPSPSSPSVVDPQPTGARPLVYADGATVHVGDDSFDAGGTVIFLDATDDGVVFVTEDSDRLWYSDTLWFNDGSTTEAIGRVPTEHIAMFDVWTANPGSLVVWPDATSSANDPQVELGPYQLVVYDTSRHEVVARLPRTGRVLYVDEAHIFFNPDSGAPGCWVIDIHYCKDPYLLRYDLASGTTRKIAQATFEAELSSHVRMLDARFNQVGRRLVPIDSEGDPFVLRLTTGEPVALRLPAGYRPPGDGFPLVQWLDDDRLVLFPNEANYDSPREIGDLLECKLPDGTCRVAVRASSTPYVAPGTNW